jgi:hypothetical protein
VFAATDFTASPESKQQVVVQRQQVSGSPCRCCVPSPPISVGLLCIDSIGTLTAAYTSRSGSMYRSAGAPGASCSLTTCCWSQYNRLRSSASGNGWSSGQGSRCADAAAKAASPGLLAGASGVVAGAALAAGAGTAVERACSIFSTSCRGGAAARRCSAV